MLLNPILLQDYRQHHQHLQLQAAVRVLVAAILLIYTGSSTAVTGERSCSMFDDVSTTRRQHFHFPTNDVK
jgi:hypothetical protein